MRIPSRKEMSRLFLSTFPLNKGASFLLLPPFAAALPMPCGSFFSLPPLFFRIPWCQTSRRFCPRLLYLQPHCVLYRLSSGSLPAILSLLTNPCTTVINNQMLQQRHLTFHFFYMIISLVRLYKKVKNLPKKETIYDP